MVLLQSDALKQVAQAALKEWSLAVKSVKLHSRSENAVFRVETAAGEAYALRVHRPGHHSLAALESEHVWTDALAAAGLSVPTALHTRAGRAYATVALPNSTETRHVGLLKWVAGATLAEALDEVSRPEEVAALYENLGRLVADLHLASAQWSPPPGFVRHAWDAPGLVGEQPFWGRFWEIDAASEGQRAKLLALRNRLFEILSALPQGADAYGMIHADLNCGNVLHQGEQLCAIDFDDAGFGWHAFDLAVAVWDRMDVVADKGHFDAAQAGLLRGYRSGRPSCGHVLRQVPLFLLVRSLMLLRWMQDRPEAGYADDIPKFIDIALDQARRLPTPLGFSAGC